ncbi:MAG: hypothetical protein PHC66_05200, partial [Candidatus Nanoarchaeia archaeon]|nr:hypothetical protein [Candidatus Nanoarchaeia archaeon]
MPSIGAKLSEPEALTQELIGWAIFHKIPGNLVSNSQFYFLYNTEINVYSSSAIALKDTENFD